MVEVKPWETATDLDKLALQIQQIQVDGLEWKTEYNKEAEAEGGFKLMVSAVVDEQKVSASDVRDQIEALEEFVKSAEIASRNRFGESSAE